MDPFFAVTGGPGSGKTTLVDALAKRGLATSGEAGRAVIRDQLAIGGTALPWGDRAAFAALMLHADLRAWRRAARAKVVTVFDRGLPDIIGYRRLVSLPVSDRLARAAERYRYNKLVFVAPPWPDIFAQDAVRKQTPAEAEATFHAVSAAYRACGYELVMLPRVALDARVAFVLATIRQAGVPACADSAPAAARTDVNDAPGNRAGPA